MFGLRLRITKGVSVSASIPKARKTKSAGGKKAPNVSKLVAKSKPPNPSGTNRPSRVSTVSISGAIPAEWLEGTGEFEGLYWNGKNWLKVSSDSSETLSERTNGLPDGWLRGSGSFAGKIWNGQKWVSDTEYLDPDAKGFV